LTLGLVGVLLAAGCSGGGGGGGSGSLLPTGSIAQNPDTGGLFVVDANGGGSLSQLKVVDVYWGRLVDIRDFDATTGASQTMFSNYVIGDDIANDGVNYRLDRDPVTEAETLTILHKYGTLEFDSSFRAVDANLQLLLKKSLDPTEVPPFTAVPRNAALMLRFNDVLDDGGNPGDLSYPGRVTDATIKLLVQNPPVTPYEGRILPDPNHGDLITGKFHSTRVIIDLTVSQSEALQTSLPVNSLGLPAADSIAVANAVLRLPTKVNAAEQQFTILTNLAGKAVSFTGDGPTDPFSGTLDVVRAFRSGGKTAITGDANDGFLPDDIPPVLLGAQIISLTQISAPQGANGDEFLVDILFGTPACATPPRVGDVLDLPNHRAQVIAPYFGTISVGLAAGVRVQLSNGSVASFVPPLSGLFKTSFNPALGDDPRCFVRFLPQEASPPGGDVPLNASMVITFSEPMNPATVQAFDTFTLTYNTPMTTVPPNNPLYKFVVGHIVPSQDLRQYTFVPEVPLRHTNGVADGYTAQVIAGASGATDLAGNPLGFGLSGVTAVNFSAKASDPTFDSASASLKFDSTDEDLNGGPEIRGQFLYDLAREVLKPRAVTRFSAVADPSVPVVGAMIPIQQPIQTPLSNHGSKMMGVWRYHDLGFGLLNESTHNLDVEGLSWTLFFSGLQIDNFSRFQMSLAHSKFLPDETISSGLLPNFPSSGLVAKFQDNLLDPGTTTVPGTDPLTVVHPQGKGYTVGGSPDSTFTVPSGLTMTHWPWNQGVPISNFTYWTWRDTAKIKVAAPAGTGADTGRLLQVTKIANVGFYPASKVPTIGLPMLMEFRTWKDDQASGQNGFRIAIAINSSAMPFFRAFSTGGVLQSGQIVSIDPDTEVTATGGINPATGSHTQPRDNSFYYGQGDFVVKVSRMHTIWFDSGGNSTYVAPVVEPGPSTLPSGTQVVLAFRGASGIAPANSVSWQDASNMDAYGESYTAAQLPVFGKVPTLAFTPTFFGNSTDNSWKGTLPALNGARFFQARVSFLSNPETALTPELSALGFAFYR
jgi:hypothetical protein